MASRIASLALCLLAALGCAHTPPAGRAPSGPGRPDAPAPPGAARVRAALDALSAQKGYRIVCRDRSGGIERVSRLLLIAPDYVHAAGDGGEWFARGTHVVRRSSSGRGWLREECAPRVVDDGPRLKALLDAACVQGRFEEPRTEEGCEILAFTIEGEEAINRVWPMAGTTRMVVTLWVNSDGIPFRVVKRWEGDYAIESECELSDFGIDSDPGIPEPVRRLLDAPDEGQLPFTEDRS